MEEQLEISSTTHTVSNGDHTLPAEDDVKRPRLSSEGGEQHNRTFAAGDSIDEPDAAKCESVKILDEMIDHHKNVYSKETIAKHFHDDVLNVANKCWEQVNQSILTASEAKFRSVLDEFTVKEKLTELDRLWDESDPDQPAWRPSGTPSTDAAQAEGMAVRQVIIPQFEEELKKVNVISSELQNVLKKKQERLKALEEEIKSEVRTLGEFVDTLPK